MTRGVVAFVMFMTAATAQIPYQDKFVTLNGLRIHYLDWGGDGKQQSAGNAVGDVVMTARRVVDAVPATPRGPTLQPRELGCEARQVEQLRLSAVQER